MFQVGNRMKLVNGTTTTLYTYGTFNRLSSAGSTTYTYDANGNMITKSGGWTYAYDYENRMTSASLSGTLKQINYYDGSGIRVESVVGSTKTYYLSYGGNILYEGGGSGIKRFYANGMQVAKMVGTTTYYMHGDELGSTRLVMTGGTISFSSNYVPYGVNKGAIGSEVFMYTGKPYDSATGLYYFGARYYDPSTGRFITQDSYSGSRNDPMSLNLYIYARDNPERMVDPNGHAFIDDSGYYYPASGTALVTAGVISAPTQTTTATATTTGYTDVNKVSYTSSLPTVTTGTSAKSIDMTLTQQRVDQYANAPTIGTSSVGSQIVNCLEHQCGATLVTGIMVDTSVALSLVTAAAATGNVVDPLGPFFIPVTTGLTALTAASWESTAEMATYDYQYGSSATPQGALEHGGQGILQLVDWLAEHIP